MAKLSPKSQGTIPIRATYSSGSTPRSTNGQAGGVNSSPPKVKNVGTSKGITAKHQAQVTPRKN